jgi:hypothetical protein
MRTLGVLGLLATLAWVSAGAAPVLPGADRYELGVKLDPARQSLAVEATLKVRFTGSATSEATWVLNRQLEVKALTGPLVSGWTFDRGGGALKVRFRRPLGPADLVQFKVRYQGVLDRLPDHGANVVSRGWTELGPGSGWLPLRQGGGPFTFRLAVQGPPGYGLVSCGPFRPGPGGRTLEGNQAVPDLILVAAPAERLRVLTPAPRVRLVTTDLGAASAARLAKALGQVVTSFRRRLGPPEAGALTLVQTPRPDGGPSTGPGFLAVPGLTEANLAEHFEDLLQQAALTTGRTWWNRAPADTWEDWLNVSMAEYSALTVLREVAGPASYQRRIELKRRASEGLPPLWQFDRNGRSAQAIMEAKGVILLAELEGFVGQDRFAALCRELAAQKVLRTTIFLDLLEARAGKPVREAFQRRIMSL